jgi:nucleoside-diphosphate-sugar epimerase
MVTGASGFIGRPLCAFLQRKGCKVRALLRRETEGPWDETVICKLGYDSLPARSMQDVDTVFHLAAMVHAMQPGKGRVPLYEAVNVRASEMLATAAADRGVRHFVYFSSVKAAADPGEKCVDERWQALPRDPYGLSKREAEESVLNVGKRSNMQVSVLRPVLVYGPGVKGNLQRMIEAIDSGRFPPLPETGNRRSMVHVDDLIEAAWLAATHPQANDNVYIVSDGEAYSSRQIYVWMTQALGRKVPAWHLPVSVLSIAATVGDVFQQVPGWRMPFNTEVFQRLTGSACYQAGKLRHDLCWGPRRRLHEALPDMVAAYRRLRSNGVS